MRIRRPIAVGADWALVRLASGEYLCVDTTTFEGLGYILGWQHEADVIRVFRTFLTQRSIVLDIGANFGLYTALSASIVKNHGRLYAFEGNPRIFESLRPPPPAEDEVAPIYLRQLAAYQAALERIYPDREIRCALLWTEGPRLMPISPEILAGYLP